MSKTAPTGEYLTTGSFMVRGKKNFLPHSHLVYGFGFLFRLEESSVKRHANERRVKSLEEDMAEASDTVTSHALQSLAVAEQTLPEEDEVELSLSDGDDDENVDAPKVDVKSLSLDDVDEEDHDDKIINDPIDKSSADDVNVGSNNTESLEFPDTVVKMTHIAGDTFALSTSISATQESKDPPNKEKINTKQRQKKKAGPRQSVTSESSEVTHDASTKHDGSAASKEDAQNGPLKRGQRSKLKKMKTKYRDQDDEERELRMQLLQV